MVALVGRPQVRATGEPEGQGTGRDRLKLHTPLLGDDVEGAEDGFLGRVGPAGAEDLLVFEEAGDGAGGGEDEGGEAGDLGGGKVAEGGEGVEEVAEGGGFGGGEVGGVEVPGNGVAGGVGLVDAAEGAAVTGAAAADGPGAARGAATGEGEATLFGGWVSGHGGGPRVGRAGGGGRC